MAVCTATLSVTLAGEPDPELGWFVDFGDVSAVVKPMVDEFLDHHHLNDILSNPTSENLCVWLWDALDPTLVGLAAIGVSETCTSACELRR